jgi:hypothetical protein
MKALDKPFPLILMCGIKFPEHAAGVYQTTSHISSRLARRAGILFIEDIPRQSVRFNGIGFQTAFLLENRVHRPQAIFLEHKEHPKRLDRTLITSLCARLCACASNTNTLLLTNFAAFFRQIQNLSLSLAPRLATNTNSCATPPDSLAKNYMYLHMLVVNAFC